MSTLVRRADTVAVIGRALLARAEGSGHRSVAVLLGRPVSTVRGWLRRFGVRAEGLRVLFTGLLHVLDATAGGPDLKSLQAPELRLVVGVGEDSTGQLCQRVSTNLAERLGQQVALFPGGHIGFVEHPAAFNARLREALA